MKELKLYVSLEIITSTQKVWVFHDDLRIAKRCIMLTYFLEKFNTFIKAIRRTSWRNVIPSLKLLDLTHKKLININLLLKNK